MLSPSLALATRLLRGAIANLILSSSPSLSGPHVDIFIFSLVAISFFFFIKPSAFRRAISIILPLFSRSGGEILSHAYFFPDLPPLAHMFFVPLHWIRLVAFLSRSDTIAPLFFHLLMSRSLPVSSQHLPSSTYLYSLFRNQALFSSSCTSLELSLALLLRHFALLLFSTWA
ncbi:hypothetical protein H4582DRAFT_464657 [Lactarius indigo]|nr:hypothetical protein H4582DRAFT_464657 [Lactarius indigo]